MRIIGKCRRKRRPALRYSNTPVRVNLNVSDAQNQSQSRSIPFSSSSPNFEMQVTSIEKLQDQPAGTVGLHQTGINNSYPNVNRSISNFRANPEHHFTNFHGSDYLLSDELRSNIVTSRRHSDSDEEITNMAQASDTPDTTSTHSEEEILDDDEISPDVTSEINQESSSLPQSISTSYRITHWTQVLAIILVTGSVRFTRNQYDTIRILVLFLKYEKSLSCKWSSAGRMGILHSDGSIARSPLPSYSKVQKVLKPAIEQNLGAKYYDVAYNHNTKQVRRILAGTKLNTKLETKVRIVPISEYARLDVSLPTFLMAANSCDRSKYENFTAESLLQQT